MFLMIHPIGESMEIYTSRIFIFETFTTVEICLVKFVFSFVISNCESPRCKNVSINCHNKALVFKSYVLLFIV